MRILLYTYTKAFSIGVFLMQGEFMWSMLTQGLFRSSRDGSVEHAVAIKQAPNAHSNQKFLIISS